MPDELVVGATEARWRQKRLRCAIGRSGARLVKREGDGATPAGFWRMREVLFRADRLPSLITRLPCLALRPEDGWCDDPSDPAYNRRVSLPYPASCEALWRADHIYDVIVPLGYNDETVTPGRGSAIFLHVARRDYPPTEGCVALALSDLLTVLRGAAPGDAVRVLPE